jgi:hypothetical protein
MAGSIQPKLGGMIVAYNCSVIDPRNRVSDDSFVAGGVVNVEILEITPNRGDERLSFLRC